MYSIRCFFPLWFLEIICIIKQLNFHYKFLNVPEPYSCAFEMNTSQVY